MSLPGIARLFGFKSRTTVLHARNVMRPVLAATGLTEGAPVPRWVEACLPLLFVPIAERRRKSGLRASTAPRDPIGKYRTKANLRRR
ncbi:MAG TPA: hypothetical protein VKC66_03035 [Xanthobacteraceae bacterium]|nr:hypothetical protein [Xanthobacteraceae bacterium]